GLWRWKPGPPKRYDAWDGKRAGDLIRAENGNLLLGLQSAGLKQVIGDKLEDYPIPSASDPKLRLPDRDVNSNKLLRDHEGGIWIGTQTRGLIHSYRGRTDTYTKADGLSGDIICSLFEDREGNIWVGTTGGLERFRDVPVTTISAKQGLSSALDLAVLATEDGSVWIATDSALNRSRHGHITVFRMERLLPNAKAQSLFQDDRGRLCVFTSHRLAYLDDGRLIATIPIPTEEVYSIIGDQAGNLWLSGNKGLFHLQDGRLLEHFPWEALGRQQQAKFLVAQGGGVWLAFWTGGGVLYFKDGRVQASYTLAEELGKGPVASLYLDRDAAIWAATQESGLSRIKDGHVATLTTRNGLPCDEIHWAQGDDGGSLWLYTACGLVRINENELKAWIADSTHRVETTVWDAADGVRLISTSPGYFNPPVAKSKDGKLWFLVGDGIQVIDPNHLPFNKVPPPVHIERVVADHKTYWQDWARSATSNVHLPPRVRDLQIDYTALSFVAPGKIHFKYKLEGQDQDWREVVNDREVQYSNLPPRQYRFRILASNNSGVWNESGDSLEFSIDAAYYQTSWFYAGCAFTLLALLWTAHHMRVRQLQRAFHMTTEARLVERTRIARELHDNLLQTVQALMLRLAWLQAASERMPPGTFEHEFEQALEMGDRAIAEGRQAVQELRSAPTTGHLIDEIHALGEELSTGHDTTFRLVVEGRARELNAIVRDEICSIAREALRNAFAHASAEHIEVTIGFEDRLLRFR
ncbi:MAG: hypothetical protein JO210_15630, partial [Acidobacteriaceae bacterium]|nr:hypothetical protein [Acidobacteriaceae bacterium]